MNIFDALKGHSVVEANNLTGLRNGHMVAQSKFDKTGHSPAFLDNGFILKLDNKNELVVAEDATGTSFLHYSEEHMKFLDNAPLEMFTVPLDKKDTRGDVAAYPRAIALYEGDTFTTDNADITGEFVAEQYADVTVVKGKLTVAAAGTKAVGAGPVAKKATLPNGKDAIEVLWRGGNA